MSVFLKQKTAYEITDTTGGRAAGSYVDPALQALYDTAAAALQELTRG